MSRPYEHIKVQKERRLLDLGICQLCTSTENLQAHHIWEYSKGGPALVEGLITVCMDCHQRMIHLDSRITLYKYENGITIKANGGK